MMCYAGIDLHATNSVLVVIDEADRVLYQKRLRNDLAVIFTALTPYQTTLQGVVVESTYNWYWLVDGLMEAGYRVHLAHAPALPQDSGLKHVDDQHDAQWLAHLLRLGLLPTGYIYPKAERAVRDLLRKRSQLVRHKTMVVLSLQSLHTTDWQSALPPSASTAHPRGHSGTCAISRTGAIGQQFVGCAAMSGARDSHD